MLYKVTPAMPGEGQQGKVKKVRDPNAPPRKKRKSAVYDHEGHEVLITLMCLKCRQIKPLMQFGLRKMADGAIRNQPWCRTCRSGAGTPKPKPQRDEPVTEAHVEAHAEAAAEPVSGEQPMPVAAESPQYEAESAEPPTEAALPPADPPAA